MKKLFISAISYVALFVIGCAIIIGPYAVGYFGNMLISTSLSNSEAGAYLMLGALALAGIVCGVVSMIEKIQEAKERKIFKMAMGDFE